MSEIEEPKPKKSRKGCKIGCGVFVVILVGLGVFLGPTLSDIVKVYGWDFWRKPDKHAYSATSEQNLKAIYQAMSLYHESEGQFPDASGWMDAMQNRLESNDLKKGEAKKKLIRPDLIGQADQYGYSMNDAASAKYKDDIKDPSTTPLIYESKETTKNAHGDPTKNRDGLAISVDGKILKM
jgi:hypothetical protein